MNDLQITIKYKQKMKKLIFTLSFVVIATLMFSQNPLNRTFTQVNVGVGLSGWGVPFYIGLDRYITSDISLGGEFSYRGYKENWKSNYYNHNIIGISGNLNYHFNRLLGVPNNWDFYIGPNIGFYSWNSPDGYIGTHSSGLGLGAQLGMRYYFTNKIGLNLEVGGGNAFSGGKFGLSFPL